MVATSWEHLAELLQAQPASIAIIDPTADGARNTVEFEQLVSAHPSLQVMAYMPLTPAAFRAVASLSKVGLGHAMLYSHDDSPERLLAHIDRLRASPLTDRILAELRPSLSRLPLALTRAVEEMFEDPDRYLNAREIAVNAKVTLARLYRSFHAVDLASPKKLLIAAKLVRAYTYLGDPGQSVRSVSRKLGYRQPRILADHTFEVFGLNPSRLRTHVSETDLVARLVAWLNAREAIVNVARS